MSRRILAGPGGAALVALLTLACAIWLCGCDSHVVEPDSTQPNCPEPLNCTTVVVPGISVRVLDARTQLPLACESSGWVIEGPYQAPMHAACMEPHPDDQLKGADERAGTYTVVISSRGYRYWSRSNIVVTRDCCHVHTVELVALLEPGNE